MKRTRNSYDKDSTSSESEELHRKKLRLKVKLTEKRSEEDESPQPPEEQPERKHFCVICEKHFSSGKAYGGHVRIHSTVYNKGKMKKMKKMKKKKRKICLVKEEKEKEIDLIRADVEGKMIRCCLCGKEFQTMHSLFGHMRRHPDRSWKGIRPPPQSDDDDDVGDDDDDDDDDDDLMSRSVMMSDVTEDVQDAACILMMLSSASSNYWAEMKQDMESPKSEVKSSSCYKGKDKRSSLGFDLNQPPYHEDHP